jgi:hypothetical protein
VLFSNGCEDTPVWKILRSGFLALLGIWAMDGRIRGERAGNASSNGKFLELAFFEKLIFSIYRLTFKHKRGIVVCVW